MASSTLRGVIAAVATPVEAGALDVTRATKLARTLLNNGSDGLNVRGTTGAASHAELVNMAALAAFNVSG
jgi:dihydrodipicolinate synthase/N-acetylneuraminate lyase